MMNAMLLLRSGVVSLLGMLGKVYRHHGKWCAFVCFRLRAIQFRSVQFCCGCCCCYEPWKEEAVGKTAPVRILCLHWRLLFACLLWQDVQNG